jgi:biopolymer transport protein ExbD
MRTTVRRKQHRPPIGFIILPMIDVIFLLLLFFVIMTSFEASAKIRVDVPAPDQSQAQREASPKQVVINCEVGEGVAGGKAVYRVAANPPETLDAIAGRLHAARQANPELRVVIRGDRRLAFSEIKAVMQVVSDAGVSTMNVAALQEGER